MSAFSATGGPVAGPPQPFFHSRWVPSPAHVRDRGPDAGLPGGFRAGPPGGRGPDAPPRSERARPEKKRSTRPKPEEKERGNWRWDRNDDE